MNSKNTIRSFISLVLVCTFALSITPKGILHNWLANHSDQRPRPAGHSNMVGQAGYHCNVDNLVAESPFDATLSIIELLHPTAFSSNKEGMLYSFYSLHHFYSELRGPPFFS